MRVSRRYRPLAEAAVARSFRPQGVSRQTAAIMASGDRTEGLRRFVRETKAEIDKVNWPDRETTTNLTLLVIGLSIVLGLLLGGIDFVLYRLFEAF